MKYPKNIHRMIHNVETKDVAFVLLNRFLLGINRKEALKAFKDLQKLMRDSDNFVKDRAIRLFKHTLKWNFNKAIIWNELHQITLERDSNLRKVAANYIGIFYSNIYDQEQAWEDLKRLTGDNNRIVRRQAILSLGLAFTNISNKNNAIEDLNVLTFNNDWFIRVHANYFLGSAYISIALETMEEEKFKIELKKAIDFFEKSFNQANKFNEATVFNPSLFCFPFYRSFYMITFQKEMAKFEVQRYLGMAKKAVGVSESKEKLFNAVKNLSDALNEIQNAQELEQELSFEVIKYYFKRAKNHCDKAIEIVNNSKYITPKAAKTIERGIPIFEFQIQEIIKQIKEKAQIGCQQSINTPNEELACAVNEEVQNWFIGNQKQLSKYVENIIFILKAKIPYNLDNKFIMDDIDKIWNEKDITRQYEKILYLIGLIPLKITMINNSKNIEIRNSKIDRISQADNIYIDKSIAGSFDTKEFIHIIEEIKKIIKKTSQDDNNIKFST